MCSIGGGRHARSVRVNTEGMDLNYSTTIDLPGPRSAVKVTVIHGNGAVKTVTAYDAAGNVVDVETISGPERTSLSVTATDRGIVWIEIDCPSNEANLVELSSNGAG